MSVYFTSDLHLGHVNICKFRSQFCSPKEHEEFIINDWDKTISKYDDVYVLGDACFNMESIAILKNLKGRKFLIRGNHDECDSGAYLKAFNEIYGIKRYKNFWLSHAPIHPNELRGKINLHGHVHNETIQDTRYFNCCLENLWKCFNSCFVELDQLRKFLDSNERPDLRL